MGFTAKDVKELRDKTGAGMMDCKKALTENSGDIEAAIDFLRQKGLAAAAKKATRVAAEGIVSAVVEGNVGVIVEINCETDFVAKNEDFKNFVTNVANHVVSSSAADVDGIETEAFHGKTLQETLQELTLKIGEKLEIRRFTKRKLSGEGRIGSYVHGGKIGVLVEVSTEAANAKKPELVELVNDLCLHVAASDPKFLDASSIDEDYKTRESKVYEAQLLDH